MHPEAFAGPSPGVMKFRARIYSEKAQTITYHWTRSDGALTPQKSLTFPTAGEQPVFTSWTTSKSGWMTFKILKTAPVIESKKAEFTVTCGSAGM